MSKIIFPPRPKGKMLPHDLLSYERTGKWFAQRKFSGSRILLHISQDKIVTAISRHGCPFSRFVLDQDYADEIVGNLNLDDAKEYWLDGELMNKHKENSNKIILFDVLQAGRYMFGYPNQIKRMEMLASICGNPCQFGEDGTSLKVTSRIFMAETFQNDFVARFSEAERIEHLEGLVLRRTDAALDNFGTKPYETTAQIRCRKPFSQEKGYEF